MAEQLLGKQLKKKILVLDGAMGTMIQEAGLTADDFGGEEFEGCNEYLNITRPDLIEEIHSAYLESGADMIETNTFGATRIVLDEYGLGDQAVAINLAAARIAKKAARRYSTEEWPRFVAGSMGPTTKTLSVTGGATFEELTKCYYEQALGLLEGKVDLLLVETSQDLLNVKAAFSGISQAFEQTGIQVPIMISGTIEPMGTTLAGQNIEAFYLSVEHMKPISVGLNCATGPEFMTDHLRTLAGLSDTAVSCYPNAGLPDEEGHYHESPESLAKKMSGFAEKGWLNIVGGCCGTTPAHIKALAEAVKGYKPRQVPTESHPHAISGIEPLIYDETMRPLLVGERTNVIGSRKFKKLIADGKYEEAAEIARAQVKAGAHVIDICLADPDRDELLDMEHFIKQVVNKVKVPLVIDSTDEAVIERALMFTQGKVIINSINLEDGEERFEKIVPLIRRFGAAVVVGTIDEKGMAVTAERKLEIAERSYDLLVHQYGLAPTDLIFDPLVFPVGTGDEQYIGSASETVEGIAMIKRRFPECMTILGISNVSFGLPPVGREVLNSVFLYHCTQAGLDYAIVNTEKLERFASIPREEIDLAEQLLFHTTDETLATFTEFYRGKKKEEKQEISKLTLEERLGRYVVEGTKEGLLPDLDEALAKYPNPLSIINGPLMSGMTEVGRLFNDNQLIVAEVLQSAEVMKAAVSYLEPHMEKQEGSGKGKVLLATVKGDVHDIGKNLVDIILTNNGFDVVDLGIKVTPPELIEAVKKEEPDLIGLSGLLVKSAQQMVLTAQDLKEAGISLPILVGGAALSRKFTEQKIAQQYNGPVLYAKDAMKGLELANRLQDQNERQVLLNQLAEKKEQTKEQLAASVPNNSTAKQAPPKIRSNVSMKKVHIPTDLKRHVLKNYSIDHVLPYVNKQMLFGHHLGVKGNVEQLLADKDPKVVDIGHLIEDILQENETEHFIELNGIYQFFPAQSNGETVSIYNGEDRRQVLEVFRFPRQTKAPHLCLSDYIREDEQDYVGFFSVTAGKGVRAKAKEYKENGEFLKSHVVQALALELAEGFAERVHHMMRDQWGISDPADFTMKDRLTAKYQGQRYSFGYPACPNLEDQVKLFRLLHPEEIGITLTEGFMMDPESSVTAIVFAHPEARYFSV